MIKRLFRIIAAVLLTLVIIVIITVIIVLRKDICWENIRKFYSGDEKIWKGSFSDFDNIREISIVRVLQSNTRRLSGSHQSSL